MKKDPWNFSEMSNGVLCEECSWPSPNESYIINYSKVKQIINDYPLTGYCYLKNGSQEVLLHIDAAGPPVWSEDSMCFAIPIWVYNEHGYMQRLGFGSMKDATFRISTNYYKVMQLISVKSDLVKVIEDPQNGGKVLSLMIEELDFYETVHLPNLIEVLH